jgi:shikimate kinase
MESPGPILALVGLRCVGKSSVGRRLAELTGRPFVDLDDRTLEGARAAGEEAASVGELLATIGEERFRRHECTALEDLLDEQPDEPPGEGRGDRPRCILATGGGVVETARARERLRRDTLAIWLSAELDLLRERLRADDVWRPSLTGGDPADELADLLKRRAPGYREVSVWRIECGDRGVDELAREIVRRLKDLPSSP